MSMRTSEPLAAMLLLAALAGCHHTPSGPDRNGNRTDVPVAKDNTPRIACAINGGAMAANACTVARDPDGVLTIRDPDGGFHRLRPSKDGFTTADGAGWAKVTPLDSGMIEVAIGGDRYRLPVTMRGAAGTP